MLTPTRLEEVATWMRRNGIATITAVSPDHIHISADEMHRLAPGAGYTHQASPYLRIQWTATVDGQTVIALKLDLTAYDAHDKR